MKFPGLICLLGAALLSGAAAAEEPLRPPAYETGREYILRTEQHMEMTLPPRAAGPTGQKQVMDLTLELAATCEKAKGRDGDERQLTTRVAAIHVKMASAGNAMEFDSAHPPAVNTPLSDGFKGLAGAEFTIFLNAAGDVTGFEGLNEFAVKEANPLGQQLGPEQLKSLMVNALRFGIPAEGVLPGATWKHLAETELPPAGSLKLAYAMTYSGDETDGDLSLAVIDFTGRTTLKTRTAGGPADPRLSLTAENGTIAGSVRIDRKLNFPRRGQSELKLELRMPNPAVPGTTLRLPAVVTESFELVSTKKLGLRLLR